MKATRIVFVAFVVLQATVSICATVEQDKAKAKELDSKVSSADNDAWNDGQIKQFGVEVLEGVNKLRKEKESNPGQPLTFDDDLMKAATIYAKAEGSVSRIPECSPSSLWVKEVQAQTRFKEFEAIKDLCDSAIVLQIKGAMHLASEHFVELLRDVNPDSALLSQIHRFVDSGKEDQFVEHHDSKKPERYCKRLKQLLWLPTTKLGVGAHWEKSNQVATTYYVVFFEPGRKRYEVETDRFSAKAKDLLKTEICRMDSITVQEGKKLTTSTLDSITKLRAQFGITTPLVEEAELSKKARNFATNWAISATAGDTSPFKTGFILYAQRNERGKLETDVDVDLDKAMIWDKLGVVQSRDGTTGPEFIRRLIAADRFGVPIPTSAKSPAATTAAAPSNQRLSQLLCKEATQIGFAAATYTYEYAEKFSDWTNHFVLLFNAQCKTMPAIEKSTADKLKAKGWKQDNKSNWFFEGNAEKLFPGTKTEKEKR